VKEAGCDWLNWVGYDGMLFVASFFTAEERKTWDAACFPNPVSSMGGIP